MTFPKAAADLQLQPLDDGVGGKRVTSLDSGTSAVVDGAALAVLLAADGQLDMEALYAVGRQAEPMLDRASFWQLLDELTGHGFLNGSLPVAAPMTSRRSWLKGALAAGAALVGGGALLTGEAQAGPNKSDAVGASKGKYEGTAKGTYEQAKNSGKAADGACAATLGAPEEAKYVGLEARAKKRHTLAHRSLAIKLEKSQKQRPKHSAMRATFRKVRRERSSKRMRLGKEQGIKHKAFDYGQGRTTLGFIEFGGGAPVEVQIDLSRTVLPVAKGQVGVLAPRDIGRHL